MKNNYKHYLHSVRTRLTAAENDWNDDDSIHECWEADWSDEDTVLACKEAYQTGMKSLPVGRKAGTYHAVSELVKTVENAEGTNLAGAVRDILTDLVHFCKDHGLDFDERVQAAKEVSEEEKDEA